MNDVNNYYEPELGQMVFGQPFKTYGCSNLLNAALENISEEWERVMWNINQKEMPNPFCNTGSKWKCTEFEVNAYDWNDDNEQLYNFKWKDIEVSWYKYLGRGMSCNKNLSSKKISDMLNACLKALIELEKKENPFLYI